MANIYLHIGQPKTATTTLQYFFSSNREWLLARGIYYPPSPRGDHAEKGHFCFFDSIWSEIGVLPEPSSHSMAQCQEYLDNAYKKFQNKHLLISAETFWHALDFESPEKVFSLIKTLFPYGKIKIICYLRRQDLWFESFYNEIVKKMNYNLDINAFYNSRKMWGNYYTRLKIWENYFGENSVIVKIFEREQLKNHSIIDDFCNILGINNILDSTPIENKNERLSSPVIAFKRYQNSIVMDGELNHKLFNILNSIQFDHLTDTTIMGKMMPDEMTKQILREYENENQQLAQHFFNNRKVLFKKNELYGSKVIYPGLSSDELALIINKYLVDIYEEIACLKTNIKIEPDNKLEELRNEIAPILFILNSPFYKKIKPYMKKIYYLVSKITK